MSFDTSTLVISEPEIPKAKISGSPVASSVVYLLAATAFVLISLLSSMYCLLAYIPTTYFAFIQAPFQAWMPAFARWQAHLFTLSFSALAIPVFVRFRTSLAGRLAPELLVTGGIASLYLLLVRPVQFLHNSSASFVWSIAFLIPVLHLGALECTVAFPKLKGRLTEAVSFSYTRVVLAAIFVGLGYPGAAYFRYYLAGGRKDLPESDVIVWLWAVLVEIFLFVFAFSLIAVAGKLANRTANPRDARFLGNLALCSAAVALVLKKIVLASIPFTGIEATLYAMVFSLAIVVFGAGYALRVRSVFPKQTATKPRSRYQSAVLWVFLLAALVTVPALIGVMDWNSVLEKTWAVAYWVIVAGVVVLRAGDTRKQGYAGPIIAAGLCLAGFHFGKESQQRWNQVFGRPGFDTTSALEYHSALDASFTAADELLTVSATRPCNELCQFIRQQTNIPASAPVDLHNIDLVERFGPVAGKKPNIFIIVVDSLRQDYISAYNPAVSFTPEIGAFARESVVFRNAFTRYGGTTLSEPSIWSGMLQLHKHYAQPFHLVNGLEKLIQTDHYRSFVTVDTVLRVILRPQPGLIELDRRVPDWTGVDLCSTTREALDAFSKRGTTSPIFFYTQPQNIHIVTLGKTHSLRPPAKDYSPFVSYYASELERLDGCFGRFIDALKNRGLYENSIVVLTSDHGEDLNKIGAERHGFSLKPPVIRIPLIIHVPESVKRTWYFNPDAVAFNTDVTPTVYELLGHGQIIPRPEFGRPLFTRTRAEMQRYRRDSYMIASSYGALYGELYENGAKLFVDNEVAGREEFFDLKNDPDATHSILTETLTKKGEDQLRGDIKGIAKLYGFQYQSPTLLDWLTH